MVGCSVFTHGGSWTSSRRAASVFRTVYLWRPLTIGAPLDLDSFVPLWVLLYFADGN